MGRRKKSNFENKNIMIRQGSYRPRYWRERESIQETWLNGNDYASMYNIPGYNMIHQGKICCGHGGLIIYLNDKYTHPVRKYLYKDSTVWEGLFIYISGETVSKKITLGNSYKPPKNNNNNPNITTFINEFSPLLHTLSHENRYSIWQVILIWIY